MKAESISLDPVAPSSGIVIPEIDGLRALAAMNVLACHAMVETRWGPKWVVPLFEGAIGVELFFVLSGFLLFLPFVRAARQDRRVALGPYALRRILRIFPAYYVNLALLILFVWPEGLTTAHGRWTVLAHITLTFSMSEAMVHAINPVYWTLCVEEQFYLLLPFCAALFTSRRGALWLALTLPIPNLLAAAWRAHYGPEGVALVATLPYHWSAFALGMLIALEFERRRNAAGDTRPTVTPSAFASGAFLVATLVGLFLAGYGRQLFFYQPIFLQGEAFGWALVLACVLAGPSWLGRPLRSRPVRLLGLMTFSVYLWHVAIVERVMSLSDPPVDWLSALGRLATVFVITIPFAAGSYFLVERPFMALRKRFEGRSDASSLSETARPGIGN